MQLIVTTKDQGQMPPFGVDDTAGSIEITPGGPRSSMLIQPAGSLVSIVAVPENGAGSGTTEASS